jgi:hypothetical protein
MEQFGLVVSVLPGRTEDAMGFMRELETGRNADYRRSVFVSTVRQRPLPCVALRRARRAGFPDPC